jgi:hypothetical protein
MLHNNTLSGLLGTLVLLVGTSAGASDTPSSEPQANEKATAEGSVEAEAPEMERIVVSLPNGRKYVIERPKAKSADSGSPSDVIRRLADGSRISYSLAGGSGGKAVSRRAAPKAGRNAASKGVSRAGSGVSGGSGGGSVSKLGGGGGARAGGGGGGGAGGGGGGGAAPASAAAVGAMAAGTNGASAGASSGAVRGARAPFKNTGTNINSVGNQTNPASEAPVPTIGSPRYSDDEATGGQDVTFFDAGISAMVLGRTVYIWGAEIVQSSEAFQLVEGERFAFDGAVARNGRPTTATAPLTSADQLHAPLKLEFAPGSTTTLTMFSAADNPELPDRSIRNWTLRVR